MILRKFFLPWVVVLAFVGESIADGGPYAPAPPAALSQAWCEGVYGWSSGLDKFVPDGAIIPVGPYFFRVCQDDGYTPSPDDRRMRMFFNPRRVEGLRYDKSVELIVTARGGWPVWLEASLRGTKLVGTREFGGVVYETYQHYRPYWDPVWGRKLYRYVPKLNPDRKNLPPHIITCSKELDRHPTESMNCFLHVGYDQISARLLFIGGGPELTPIPIEAFPIFAQDVLLVLKTADVTGEADELKLTIPMLD
ncbi:hypothetical protein RA2_02612 [Roseovarius sp. A-2]|uniref:hypothetical protein n=1 Tax=Roseovarius sp. A-2 TaxID=1570360 RepID=UPI0009C7E638|nr:hypothetical protein [Roseovarius sp. A-2]GAW35549.1 hypothetical protein RA2_02612 [Roseovarius sp. A-2]